MRVTVSINDTTYNTALKMADPGIREEGIFQEALKVFIRVQAGKQLAELGAETPMTEDISRRRNEPESSLHPVVF
jgi:hypothetical protein